ncbi:MAG: peptidylprolyl isomerase [Verrucomicrobiota bacterium]|nr:peptidylprolyl isomerase [Verrucomicrobiota bacterium]
MKRFLSLLLAAATAFACVPAARALTPKPNVAPVVSSQIPDSNTFRGTTRIIDLTQFFGDPDASAAVQVTTSLGTMNFTLDGQQAPITVANFLNYLNSGRYFKTDSSNGQQASLFFHRSVPGFVIQTGGFLGTGNPNGTGNVLATQVATFAAIQNEPFISNLRGTIAMAKLGGDPNSATSQWFINLADNSANLDAQNGGFTVFGRVAGNGMTVADAIAALPRIDASGGDPSSPFTALPVRNYASPNPVKVSNLVSLPGIAQISPLNFSASSSNESVATVSAAGTDLLVKGLGIGSARITVTGTDLDGASVTQSFTVNVNAMSIRLGNISTRANFASGDDDLIAGFIVRGGSSKALSVRAIGPTLANFGIQNPIADPTIELHSGAPAIAQNDNWIDSPKKLTLLGLQLSPRDDRESALIATVPSSAANTSYTAVMQNAARQPGIGLVEVYDLDSSAGSAILNLSTRGQVGTGDKVMIGGFILAGDGALRIVVRAIGPTLANFGINGALPDPVVVLRNEQGTVVDANDNWQSHPGAAEIQQNGLQPNDPRESALITTLAAGNYTATVTGTGSTPTGVGLVEIYQIVP